MQQPPVPQKLKLCVAHWWPLWSRPIIQALPGTVAVQVGFIPDGQTLAAVSKISPGRMFFESGGGNHAGKANMTPDVRFEKMFSGA